MTTRSSRYRHPLQIILVLVGLAFLGGCGILDEGNPTSARIVMEGAAGHSVQLVTTSDFSVTLSQDGDQREIFIYSADTSVVITPFDRRYDLGPGKRIYATFSSDEVAGEAVSVRVFVGGSRRYDRTTVFDGEVLEFLFTVR